MLVPQILKRFTQLSGYRIPDPILNTVIREQKSILDFVDLLTQSAQPKPEKLAAALLAKQQEALELVQMDATAEIPEATSDATPARAAIRERTGDTPTPLGRNVMIIPRRETPLDKEKEVGRWKLIEKELSARGLPVWGHRVSALGNESGVAVGRQP